MIGTRYQMPDENRELALLPRGRAFNQ